MSLDDLATLKRELAEEEPDDNQDDKVKKTQINTVHLDSDVEDDDGDDDAAEGATAELDSIGRNFLLGRM